MMTAPKFGLYVASLFDSSIKMILPSIGQELKMNNSKVIMHYIQIMFIVFCSRILFS